MATLTLEKLNDILFGALKDTSHAGKIKLIEAELSMCADIYIDAVGDVMDELVKKKYDSDKFRELERMKEEAEAFGDDLGQEEATEYLNMIVGVASEVLDELEAIGYESEGLDKCNAIRMNSEKLFAQLQELKKQVENEVNTNAQYETNH